MCRGLVVDSVESVAENGLGLEQCQLYLQDSMCKLGVVLHTCNLCSQEEAGGFLVKATLVYTVRLHLKNQSMHHLFQHNMSINIHKSSEMPNRHPEFPMSVKYTTPSLRAELENASTGQPS